MATEIYWERRKRIRKEAVKDVRPTNSERKENHKIIASESEFSGKKKKQHVRFTGWTLQRKILCRVLSSAETGPVQVSKTSATSISLHMRSV